MTAPAPCTRSSVCKRRLYPCLVLRQILQGVIAFGVNSKSWTHVTYDSGDDEIKLYGMQPLGALVICVHELCECASLFCACDRDVPEASVGSADAVVRRIDVLL